MAESIWNGTQWFCSCRHRGVCVEGGGLQCAHPRIPPLAPNLSLSLSTTSSSSDPQYTLLINGAMISSALVMTGFDSGGSNLSLSNAQPACRADSESETCDTTSYLVKLCTRTAAGK